MELSIIIPCFNREKTIERAIKTVINQTVFLNEQVEFEIIVVDDSSDDNSVQVIESMHSKYVNLIKLEENKGGNYARNVGIKHAKGEYIAFQDSDDAWLPQKIEKQLNILKNTDADVVFSSLISRDGDLESVVPLQIDEGFATKEDFLSFNKMSTQVMVGKNDCFKECLFDEELSRFQDWEIALRLITHFKVYFIKEPLAIQYIQNNSITKSSVKAYNSLISIEEKHRNIFSEFPEYHSKLFESIAFFANNIDEDPEIYLRESLKILFSKKVYIKYLLSRFNLYKLLKK